MSAVTVLRSLDEQDLNVFFEQFSAARASKKFAAVAIPFTPLPLIKEIFEKVPPIHSKNLDINIAVLYTVEMVAYLCWLGFKNITMITAENDDNIKRFADAHEISYEVLSLDKEWNMKFDVVCGNPPYQAELKTLQNRLWMQFVDKAFELVSSTGHIALITPSNWAVTPDLYQRWFLAHTPLAINVDECSKYFPGVGITFSYYVITPAPYDNSLVDVSTANHHSQTLLPRPLFGIDPRSSTIYSKVFTGSHLRLLSYKLNTHYSYRKGGKISETQTDVFAYRVMSSPETSKKPAQWLWGRVQDPKQSVPRVICALYPGWWKNMLVSEDLQTTDNFVHFPVDTLEQAYNLRSVLTSKLMLYVVLTLNSTRGIKAHSLVNLPAVDLTRSWTDEELYKHFNLTQEEIDLIESTVK